MGAWWPPRSSKPLSACFACRGVFDSLPLRQVDLRFTVYDLRFEETTRAVFLAPAFAHCGSQSVYRRKEVTHVTREGILKLTALSSCAG